MEEGWISIYRKILDNPIVCKDVDFFTVWMYLLLNASHKEQEKIFKGKKIIIKKGQLITSRKTISEKFKISESKVQRILKSFEIEQQIEQQTSSKNRLITITNWNYYQQTEQQIEQQVNNKWTASEQQVNTNNNEIINNNINNNNNNNNNIYNTTQKKIFKKNQDDEYKGYFNNLIKRNENLLKKFRKE